MKADPSLPAKNPGADQPSGLAALAASEPAYQAFLDGLPGMVFLARNDRARTVEQASAGSQALLGFKPGAKPFQLTPLIHPEDRDEVIEVVRTAVAENHPFAVEYRLRHADGHWRTVWEQGRPVRSSPRAAVQGQLLDVTHRRLREQARLATELRWLQARNFHALNQLAAGVAHEFNNLIAGILGSAELLAMDMPAGHGGNETLKQIFEASNLARDFVHRLRALGQRTPPEFKLIRLQPVVEECLQILRSIAPARVELQTRMNPDCPKVSADAAQIHQAILDLCVHAWQGMTDRRGCITISLEEGPVPRPAAGVSSQLQPGPHVCLTVQDDSPPLEKNAREHIFHPFRTRRTSGKKVGLELFLVRETILAHQGEITFESEPGRGLTFRMYLPVAAEK